MNISKNIITVLACGGAGINVSYGLEHLRGKASVGMAALDVYYLDVNRSNLDNKTVPEEKVYIFPDTKPGSGGDRKTNAEAIEKNTPAAIQFCKPGETVVIVHSAGGGSGSVIAPNITSALLSKGKNVIVIMIGDTDSGGTLKNTLTLYKNYDSIADVAGRDSVMTYFENTETHSRQAVNKQISQGIALLAALFSGQHEGLDNEDIKNFLNPGRFSGRTPQLLSLDICVTPEEIKEAGDILGVVTLATEEMNTALKNKPPYQKVGFVPHAWKSPSDDNSPRMIGTTPIHYVVSGSSFNAHVKRLSAIREEMLEAERARNQRESFAKPGDKTTGRGLIFD